MIFASTAAMLAPRSARNSSPTPSRNPLWAVAPALTAGFPLGKAENKIQENQTRQYRGRPGFWLLKSPAPPPPAPRPAVPGPPRPAP